MDGSKRKIIIGVSSDVPRLCFEIAFRQGVLKKEEAEIVQPKGEKEILERIIKGSFDMGKIATAQAIRANAKGNPVYAVAGFDNEMGHVIVGSKSIHSPGELKNRKVGVNELGDYTDQYMRTGLRYLGFTPDRDVQVIAVGKSSERKKQLASDQIQASIHSQGSALRLKEGGFPWLLQMADIFPRYQSKVIVSGETVLSQYPEGVKTVIKALIQGYRYLGNSENDEEISRIIPALNFREPSFAMAQLSVRRSRKLSDDGSMTLEGLEVVLKEAKDKGELPPDYNLSQFLRLTPLTEAQKELGLAVKEY